MGQAALRTMANEWGIAFLPAFDYLKERAKRQNQFFNDSRQPGVARRSTGVNKGQSPASQAGSEEGTSLSSPMHIAIVGMSARFPGCESVQAYWANILAGANLLSSSSEEDLRVAGIDPAGVEAQHLVRQGTKLEDAEKFDARFFEINRREAEVMDPQQRIFLECAYEALEHAGWAADDPTPGSPNSARVGVFAGTGMNTYLLQLLANPEALAAAGGYQLMLGNDKDFLATRVAYKLNLTGPAVTVQTACSTSLAAVHLACQSLLSGECDSALAGGVSVTFPQLAAYPYIPGMILSPDGACRPFDEQARGTVPGKGAGIVLLKRLAAALSDGDTVYAVIEGSAWNNDGSAKVGYTAPSVEGQAAVIRKAQAVAGVHPDRIGYIEAHGTGTELGDPIEVAALASVFRGRKIEAGPCMLGSVKSNMGHADVAAGIAGLIKATLAVHHGVVPPTLNFRRPNAALELEQTPFRVSAEAVEWPVEASGRWAGVSSFGIGGTNVHVVLRGQPGNEQGVDGTTESRPSWIFPVSAKTPSALQAASHRLAGWMESCASDSLGAVAHTLQSGRRAYPFRRSVVAQSRQDLIDVLRMPVKKANLEAGDQNAPGERKVAFLFPGQGGQFKAMASGLYRDDQAFRTVIDAGLTALPAEIARTVRPAILAEAEGDVAADVGNMPTCMAQPLLFLLEYALASRWIQSGVLPAAVVGHSLGELAAATIAGVFTLQDGLRLAVERGRLMQCSREGAMLAVSLAVDEVTPYLTDELWIAAENGPKLSVVSGEVGAIAELQERLAGRRIATVRMRSDRPFHTPHMAEAATQFASLVEEVPREMPKVPWLSNVTGTWITRQDAVSAQYWSDQITSRVRFRENANALVKIKPFLLEVGPGEALGRLVWQHDRTLLGRSTIGGVDRKGGDLQNFAEAAAALWESGANVRWEQLPKAGNSSRRKIALPTYPFERERYWVDAVQATTSLAGSENSAGFKQPASVQLHGRLKRPDVGSWFYVPSWQRTPPAQKALPLRKEPLATWLMLDSDHPLAHALAVRMRHGHKMLRLPLASATREGMQEFWKEHREILRSESIGLLCCWSLSSDPQDLFGALLDLLQTAAAARVRFAQMEFLTDAISDVLGEPVREPLRAVVEGFARVVPAEWPGVTTRIIDAGTGGSTENWNLPAERVTEELTTVPAGESCIAIRNGLRWQQTWQPATVPQSASPVFRVQGTYVITGGVGGIGFVLAKHLLETYQANVVLIGRTRLPLRERWEEWLTDRGPEDPVSRRIERTKELERLGGTLLLTSADVADPAQIEEAWKAVESRFGLVHGVIHAAGLPGGARIAGQSAQGAAEVLRPKVEGSQNLAKIAEGRGLDFLLFCSSISSVLPVAGAAAYAAANAFQDAYAVWCRQHLGIPAMAVNFDAWQEVGMAAEATGPPEFQEEKVSRLQSAMSPKEGIEVIERILAWGEPRVLVSTVDFHQVLLQVVDTLARQTTPQRERPAMGPKGVESASADLTLDSETLTVMTLWRTLLAAETVDPEDNFFELGGHSLLGTMVLARIREEFGVELSIRTIFEAPTPRSLGDRIREAIAIKPVTEQVASGGDREEFEF